MAVLTDEEWHRLLTTRTSMNRGDLDGASRTMDDRFTGYDAASIAACRLEGGKMLRIDDEDAGTVATLQACARAVTELAGRAATEGLDS